MQEDLKRAVIANKVQELQELIESLGASPFVQPNRIHLPNLRCLGVQFSPGAAALSLEIIVTVDNNGLARSPACEIIGNVWLSKGGNKILSVSCPSLRPGESSRILLGTVSEVEKEQFVNATVIIDPSSDQRPGGSVWESTKEDNVCSSGIWNSFADVGDLPFGEPSPKVPGWPHIDDLQQA